MEQYSCGQAFKEIRLGVGEEKEIELSKYFHENDTCHYTFSVFDEVPANELSPTNLKYMQVYVEQFDALEIYVAAGEKENNIRPENIRKVSSGERNFTMPPTQKFFVLVNGTQDAKYPQFDGKIKFRYYQYEPKCAEFTAWDGY